MRFEDGAIGKFRAWNRDTADTSKKKTKAGFEARQASGHRCGRSRKRRCGDQMRASLHLNPALMSSSAQETTMENRTTGKTAWVAASKLRFSRRRTDRAGADGCVRDDSARAVQIICGAVLGFTWMKSVAVRPRRRGNVRALRPFKRLAPSEELDRHLGGGRRAPRGWRCDRGIESAASPPKVDQCGCRTHHPLRKAARPCLQGAVAPYRRAQDTH